MERLCEELDEAKAEIDRLRGDLRGKSQSFESLKRSHEDLTRQLESARSKVEFQTGEIGVKEEQVQELGDELGKTRWALSEKETIARGLNEKIEKLRASWDGEVRRWEEEKRQLVLFLEEANEKEMDRQREINVIREEIEGLKGIVSDYEKRCLGLEKRAKVAEGLGDGEGVVVTLEEQKVKVEEKLKWKNEQFEHLEEAHKKLWFEFEETEKEWQRERCMLVDEVCSLQDRLDSQTRVSQGLENQLKMCSHALAHEESRRKALELEVSELEKRFGNVCTDYEDAKLQVQCLTGQRDSEIAALRHSLLTKETHWKEVEYQSRKLEQENRELLESLKEIREARIREAGNGSSLAKPKNKVRSMEQVRRDCAANLRAKEAEWISRVEKLSAEVTVYRSALESSEAAARELEIELESCHSALLQAKLQNEEDAIALLVLKSGVAESQSNFEMAGAEISIHNRKTSDEVSSLMKQLEMKNAALAKAQMAIERGKVESLQEKVEYMNPIEVENDLQQKIEALCSELDMVNSELVHEREKVVSLSTKAESLDRVEEKLLLQEKELEMWKQMLEESYNHQRCLEEKAFQTETNLQEMIREISDALDETTSELSEERKRTESISLLEEQKQGSQIELEGHKEMLEESVKSQQYLEKEAMLKENGLKEELERVCGELDSLSSDLAATMCEGNAAEFELWIWKSIAQQLNDGLVENQAARKELEASLLSQVGIAETMKQEKCGLMHKLESAEQESLRRELEGALLIHTMAERGLNDAKAKEKMAAAEILGRFEVEETKLMVREIEVDICNLQRKLESQENELRTSEALVRDLMAENSSMGELKAAMTSSMEEKLAGSEVLGRFELEARKLMVGELEDDICNLQRKLESQENKYALVRSLMAENSSISELKAAMSSSMEEKLAAAVILGRFELEERKLMVGELEDDICNLQRKLESQGNKLRTSEALVGELEDDIRNLQRKLESQGNKLRASDLLAGELAEDICNLQRKLESQGNELRTSEALVHDLMAENSSIGELKEAATSMEEKLRTSDASVRELMNEKRRLIAERENMLSFLARVGNRISRFSAEDLQLMKMLDDIAVDSCEEAGRDDGGSKESIDRHRRLRRTMAKRYGAAAGEERSPLKELNG